VETHQAGPLLSRKLTYAKTTPFQTGTALSVSCRSSTAARKIDRMMVVADCASEPAQATHSIDTT
jgi:hypothetical protein